MEWLENDGMEDIEPSEQNIQQEDSAEQYDSQNELQNYLEQSENINDINPLTLSSNRELVEEHDPDRTDLTPKQTPRANNSEDLEIAQQEAEEETKPHKYSSIMKYINNPKLSKISNKPSLNKQTYLNNYSNYIYHSNLLSNGNQSFGPIQNASTKQSGVRGSTSTTTKNINEMVLADKIKTFEKAQKYR